MIRAETTLPKGANILYNSAWIEEANGDGSAKCAKPGGWIRGLQRLTLILTTCSHIVGDMEHKQIASRRPLCLLSLLDWRAGVLHLLPTISCKCVNDKIEGKSVTARRMHRCSREEAVSSPLTRTPVRIAEAAVCAIRITWETIAISCKRSKPASETACAAAEVHQRRGSCRGELKHATLRANDN